MSTKKRKKRASNPGRPPTPLGEDAQCVRGPRALLDAMRAHAIAVRLPVAEVWRQAAVMLLTLESAKK